MGEIIIKEEDLNNSDAEELINYSKVILETRVINKNAVNFYKKNQYKVIKNYGKYTNNDEAICFEKEII